MFAPTVTRALSGLGLDQRGTDPHPRQPAPMLLQRADNVFASPDWVYEAKWDGFRVLASVRDGAVRLISRNGHSFTRLFGPISDAMLGFPTSVLLDGEVIAINDRGRPDFEALQARLRPRNGNLPGHLCYMVFDVLYVNGHSLLNRPLEERQAVLWELQPALQTDAVKLSRSRTLAFGTVGRRSNFLRISGGPAPAGRFGSGCCTEAAAWAAAGR